MRTAILMQAGCGQHPTINGLERPTGGLLSGDVFIRGNHTGANAWFFTLFLTLADAEASTNAIGVAGSEFPEGSGEWPVQDQQGTPPDTSQWVLRITLPATPPDGPCVDIWKWTANA